MRKTLMTLGSACLMLAATVAVQADMKSSQRSQVKFEGGLGRMMNMLSGKAAKEGVVSTIAIQGNKMMTVTDTRGELVDLDAEKVYSIDFKGKSYTAQTFAELRKQLEEAKAKAKEGAGAGAGGDAGNTPASNLEVSVDVKKTGEQKTLVGETCQQFILTITMHQKGKTLEAGGGMVLTSDMWLGPAGSSAKEQADFQRRYMKKLFGTDAEVLARDLMSAMAMYPGLQDGMARMQKELAKMQGTPYYSVTTFENVMTAEQAQARAEQDKSSGGGIGGLAGGLGGMLRRKKAEEPAADAKPGGAKGRSTFMTATSELLSVGSAVAPADVEIPTGFKLKN